MTFQRTLLFSLAVSAAAFGCRARNRDDHAPVGTTSARAVEGTGNTGAVTTGTESPSAVPANSSNDPNGAWTPGARPRATDGAPSAAGTAPSGTGNSNTDLPASASSDSVPSATGGPDSVPMANDAGIGSAKDAGTPADAGKPPAPKKRAGSGAGSAAGSGSANGW